MQKELETDYPEFNFQLVGINKLGKESGNEQATDGRDIPLLQDVDADDDGSSDAWTQWNVDWRDVVILDAAGTKVGTYNLTKHDLADPANYSTLRQMFVDAANLDQPKPTPLIGLDLLDVSDSGADPTDDRTNLDNGSTDRVLQVRVGGATAGATVRLFANGIQIGQAVASADVLIVTSDGAAELADGLTHITATQQVAGRISDASTPLDITIDTAISPFSSTPPSNATVDLLFSYDAQNLDEGETGLGYSLDGAPAGVSIDTVTGILNWTPSVEQAGEQHFTIVATDLAGNQRSQVVDVVITIQDDPTDDPPDVDEDSGDFALSSLSGVVYIDINNDGVFDRNEQPICHAVITLNGTDYLDQPVNATRTTGADGSYSFHDLAPGRYRVTEQQPEFLIDGKETVGSLDGDHSINDEFVVELAQDAHGINYDFGERGRQSNFIGIADFFASTPRQGMLAAFATGDGPQWHSGNGDWLDHQSMAVEWSVDQEAVKVTTASATEQAFTSTIALDDVSRIRSLGNRNGMQLVRIHGSMARQRSRPSPSAGGAAVVQLGSAEGESQGDRHSASSPEFGLLLPTSRLALNGANGNSDAAVGAAVGAVHSRADRAPRSTIDIAPIMAPRSTGAADASWPRRTDSSHDVGDDVLDDQAVDLLIADDSWLGELAE